MSTKAKGRSISFRPEWLYFEAKKYGASLEPQRNVSAVVCDFVRAGLTTAGWELPADDAHPHGVVLSRELAAALLEIQALGIDPVDTLRARLAELSTP